MKNIDKPENNIIFDCRFIASSPPSDFHSSLCQNDSLLSAKPDVSA